MNFYLLVIARHLRLIAIVLTDPLMGRRRWYGSLLLLSLLPIYILWMLWHLAGLLLDELLFPRYRKQPITNPIFLVGPPRTGTTHLHRVLARHSELSTFSLWECLFALSVSQRKLFLGIAALDRFCGRPLARVMDWVEGKLAEKTADIHRLSLLDPEEDFLVLIPLTACFLLTIPLPKATWLWDIARLDTHTPEKHRRKVLGFYRACVQKHLYVFGPQRRFLSKNASFPGMANELLRTFPGAHIIATMRAPEQSVPSQLSSLKPAWRLFGLQRDSDCLNDVFVSLMAYYYQHLAQVIEQHPNACVVLDQSDLREQLLQTLHATLAHLNLTIDRDYGNFLRDADLKSQRWRSAHCYQLEDFGLNAKEVRRQFANAVQMLERHSPNTRLGTQQ